MLVPLYPALGLALLAFSVPFGDALKLPVGGLTLGATEAVLSITALAWVARTSIRQRRPELACPEPGRRVEGRLDVPWPGLWAALAVFLAVGAFSLTVSAAPALSLKELVKWLELGLAFLLAATLVERRRDVLVVAAALLVAGATEALYGLSQAGSGSGPTGYLLGGGALRAFGSFGQPNPFAAYLALLLGLGSGLALAFSSYARGKLLTPLGLLLLGCGGLMVLALLSSYSRSALLALGTGATVIVALHSRRAVLALGAGLLVGLALLLLGAWGLLPPVVTSRLVVLAENFTLFDARDITLTSQNFPLVQRMAIWQAAWEMFLDHPLVGVGIGSFDAVYLRYALPGWPYLPGHAHNYYLNLLAETGILGLGAYLALLGSLWWQALRTVRRVQRLARSGASDWGYAACYGVALGAAGVLAVLTIHHLFDNLYVHGMAALVGLLLGLAAASVGVAESASRGPLVGDREPGS
ncbi:MAG: O-antigen ligase family protein [Chloroflexi bacterium]|nr:O-antigen ligase family protein [Chloroflexota bacterium]